MKLDIQASGIKELQASLKDFSKRRLNSVVATALTRTAKTVSQSWSANILSTIDRPTAPTLKAVSFTGAKADSLQSTVFLKDKVGKAEPSVYLAPHEVGGDRLLKKFERALVNSGAMPSGYFTVPGRHATLDSYGNVSRAQLVAVIRSLGAQYSPGYQRVISRDAKKLLAAQARHGRQYIAVTPQESKRSRVSPGIYERMADGSRRAIFLFKSGVVYKKRLKLVDRQSVQDIERTLQAEVSRAVNESLVRLAAKKAAQ
jgi:hypothetical protein